ncbi:hypothetical protein [Paenirhodobacter populi]|uniref:UrcA family protein n=1 Tax=Paenirhodobacter populi TaxID=2306993 RepID=A0A443JJP2_9RHOB|nr:hypothetical protein [Sinirhodobacter populi]RWR20819.1 hypothetical protein D2T30_10630 [Sinirhodobacter populi]
MMRRDLLCVAPLALLPITAPGQADATETPVMRLFRAWQAAEAEECAAYRAHPDTPKGDAICEAMRKRRTDIEDRMMATPCVTAQDFTAKVAAWTSFGVFGLPSEREAPGFWAEARALVWA